MFRLKTSAGKTTWAHWKDQTSHVRSHHEGIPMNSHPDAYFNALFGQLEIQITALVEPIWWCWCNSPISLGESIDKGHPFGRAEFLGVAHFDASGAHLLGFIDFYLSPPVSTCLHLSPPGPALIYTPTDSAKPLGRCQPRLPHGGTFRKVGTRMW